MAFFEQAQSPRRRPFSIEQELREQYATEAQRMADHHDPDDLI